MLQPHPTAFLYDHHNWIFIMASPYRIQRLILCLGVLPFGILSLVWYIITFIMLCESSRPRPQHGLY